jgi:hypothetical protein
MQPKVYRGFVAQHFATPLARAFPTSSSSTWFSSADFFCPRLLELPGGSHLDHALDEVEHTMMSTSQLDLAEASMCRVIMGHQTNINSPTLSSGTSDLIWNDAVAHTTRRIAPTQLSFTKPPPDSTPTLLTKAPAAPTSVMCPYDPFLIPAKILYRCGIISPRQSKLLSLSNEKHTFIFESITVAYFQISLALTCERLVLIPCAKPSVMAGWRGYRDKRWTVSTVIGEGCQNSRFVDALQSKSMPGMFHVHQLGQELLRCVASRSRIRRAIS